jgi:cytochrome b6-f complex iron-sulfur subunit
MGKEDDSGAQPGRRDFLGWAIAGTAGTLAVAAAYPAVAFISPSNVARREPVGAGKLDDFPVGTARVVLFGERPALVIRTPDGGLKCFVAVCTHLQCIVRYSEERGQIECPCHQGLFNLQGQNIAGPPPRPLEELRVTAADGNILVGEV